MRTTTTPCDMCKGKGYTIEYRLDDYYLDTYAEKVTCLKCKGRGVEVRKHADLIRCVCGKSFATIEELGEHRKTHT